MTEEIRIIFKKDGKVIVETSGFPDMTCMQEMERLADGMSKKGVPFTGRDHIEEKAGVTKVAARRKTQT